ncbi:MAG TPA: hypothetical protein PLO56_02970 [Rhodothermales bacterium]|nr:hypothetical protein [Rhodothermales bacterium]
MDDFLWLQSRYLTLQSGTTGLSFDALSRFSEPLWVFYGLEKSAVLDELEYTEDLDLMDTAVSIMESARLFWAYFRTPKEKKAETLGILEDRMLGEMPEPEDQEDFRELVEKMEAGFKRFSKTAIQQAEENSGYKTQTFQQVIEALEADQPTPATTEIFLADDDDVMTQSPDVLARFAAPLLEKIDPSDPDAFDESFSKAADYWEYARSPESEKPRILMVLKRKYAKRPEELALIENEAQMMSEQFVRMFSAK